MSFSQDQIWYIVTLFVLFLIFVAKDKIVEDSWLCGFCSKNLFYCKCVNCKTCVKVHVNGKCESQ